MTNVDEKKSKKKPVNTSEISTLIHTPSDHHASSYHKEASSIHSYEANINDVNKRHANETSAENIHTGTIGLEDIFPINPEVVHSAQLNLAVEQEAAAATAATDKKQESLFSFSAAPTSLFFDFSSTFWRFFWHDFNHLLQNSNQHNNQKTNSSFKR